MKNQQRFKIEDVDKLSRGKRTGKRIGSRAVGHHLYAFERKEYDLANKRGYMTVNNRSRENLWNIWQKATEAKGWPCFILLKQLNKDSGQIFHDGKVVFDGELKQAKEKIVTLSKACQ